MTGSRFRELTSHRARVQFAELLKVQARLALREPYGLLGGIALPAVLLAVFGFIGRQVPGNVGDTGLTIIDLWTPTILVLAFLYIAVSLPNTLVRDREIGWLRRVSTTPLHPAMLLAAQLIFDLVLAAAAVLIVILGGALVFGASLHVQILPFVVSLLLSIAERSAWCWWP
jgi:ABC-2 type transport system permease protein